MEDWTVDQEAAALKQLFTRVDNRAAFARKFNVPGGPTMVNQHINALRPISRRAAMAYVRGFGVDLREICPRYATELEDTVTELSKHRSAPWPFTTMTPAQWNNVLDDDDRRDVEKHALKLIRTREPPEKHDVPDTFSAAA